MSLIFYISQVKGHMNTTKKIRGLAASAAALMAATLLLTGCSGSSATSDMDGVYTGNSATNYAIVDDNTVKLYDMPDTGSAEIYEQKIADLTALSNGDADKVSGEYVVASGTIQTINGQDTIDWDHDKRSDWGLSTKDTIVRLEDTLEIGSDSYLPVDSDLSNKAIEITQAKIKTYEESIAKLSE